MKFLGAFALFWAGLFAGVLWFSLVLLPVVYGVPRSAYWAARRWIRWRPVFGYLIGPVVWSLVIVGLMAGSRFAAAATHVVFSSTPLAIGSNVGILYGVLSCFSRSGRAELSEDFYSNIASAVTPAGRLRLEQLGPTH
jgi:hypothetical protein